MIITKEQQEALVSNYVKKGYGSDQCIGFIDGIEKIIEMLNQPSPQLSQSEVLKLAEDSYDCQPFYFKQRHKISTYIPAFIAGFTHPQKPSGEWYSREQMIGFVVWNKMYLREQEHKVLTMPYGADRKLAAIAYTNLCNSIAQLLDLYIASLNKENKDK